MDGADQIGSTIPKPAAGEVAAPVSHKVQTRTAEVHICQTITMDEVLSTLETFIKALKVTKMSWADTAYNFLNCLGQVLQTKLDELV